MKVLIILGSTRNGRRGEKVGTWLREAVVNDGRFSVDYADLRDVNLPFFDEAMSPFNMTIEDYKNPIGKAWAQRVGEADAYLVITPEYNHGYSAVVKNALDWVGKQWLGKPVALVGYAYGGFAGVRAVEQLRQVVPELGLIQTTRSLQIAKVAEAFDDQNQPTNEALPKVLKSVLDELVDLAERLKKV